MIVKTEMFPIIIIIMKKARISLFIIESSIDITSKVTSFISNVIVI